MGRRGPPPTPTETLKRRGSWRVVSREGEPEVAIEIPPCPSWVRERAKPYWDEIAETLFGMGLLGKPHSTALGLLVEALADYIRRCEQAEVTPEVVETEKGSFAHPIHGMVDKAWSRVLKALREFGLTPASIAAVQIQKNEKKKSVSDKFKLA